MLHMLLLAVIGELISLLVVIIISNIDVDIVLRILVILGVLWPIIHRTLCSWIPSGCIIAQTQALWLNGVRQNIFGMVQILFWVSALA